MTKMMIQANKALFVGVFLVWTQGICSAGIFYHDLRKDPVDWYLVQTQEEGANLYVLSIDMNSDGLNDVLLSHARPGESADDEETDWKVYIKVPGGYKEVSHTIYLNWDYIALDNRGGQGTRATTFFYGNVSADTGYLYTFETESYFSVQGESINPGSDTFNTLFSNNYAKKIKTISQTELTRFYKIEVFPAGKRSDYDKGIITEKDLKILPRTDPNSDTTGTLLTYGIILGNHTTSETLQLQLQLQAQAEKFSRSQRAKAPQKKKSDAGKDTSPVDQPPRKQQNIQAPPVSRPNPPADKKETKS
jgi:hypothetical protein